MNIDDYLEQLALASGGREYVLTKSLAQALLRARQALVRAQNRIHQWECGKDTDSVPCDDATAALADTELEKALK